MTNEHNLPTELLEKAKIATNAAELLTLALENGITLTAEEAEEYYAKLHPKADLLSDEDLDHVSGGVMKNLCNRWKCWKCTAPLRRHMGAHDCPVKGNTCSNCFFYKDGLCIRRPNER